MYAVTYIEVQAGSIEEGVLLLREYRQGCAEEGASDIHALQEVHRPNRFVALELWSESTLFERHESASRTTECRLRLKAIQLSPNDQRLHSGFSIGPRMQVAEKDALFVVTHVDVPPPRKDETEVLLRRLAEHSRLEDKNARYDVFQQNAPRTNHFTVFAVWNNGPAFTSYTAAAHAREFREALGPLLGAPYDERLYKSV